jgi:hypothetical protein
VRFHIPVHFAEELAVLLVALREIVCRDEYFPPVIVFASLRIQQGLTKHGPFLFSGIVCLDIDRWSKSIKLADPILER